MYIIIYLLLEPYFDPSSKDNHHKRLTIILDEIDSDLKVKIIAIFQVRNISVET